MRDAAAAPVDLPLAHDHTAGRRTYGQLMDACGADGASTVPSMGVSPTHRLASEPQTPISLRPDSRTLLIQEAASSSSFISDSEAGLADVKEATGPLLLRVPAGGAAVVRAQVGLAVACWFCASIGVTYMFKFLLSTRNLHAPFFLVGVTNVLVSAFALLLSRLPPLRLATSRAAISRTVARGA